MNKIKNARFCLKLIDNSYQNQLPLIVLLRAGLGSHSLILLHNGCLHCLIFLLAFSNLSDLMDCFPLECSEISVGLGSVGRSFWPLATISLETASPWAFPLSLASRDEVDGLVSWYFDDFGREVHFIGASTQNHCFFSSFMPPH